MNFSSPFAFAFHVNPSINAASVLLMMVCAILFYLALYKPKFCFYLLIFTLIEPSRNLSLSDIVIANSLNIKFYEILMFFFYLGAIKNNRHRISDILPVSLVLFFSFLIFSLLNGLLSGYNQQAFNHFRPFISMGMIVAVPSIFKSPKELKRCYLYYFWAIIVFSVLEFADLYNLNPLTTWFHSGERDLYHSMMSATTGSFIAMAFLMGICVFRQFKHSFILFLGVFWCGLASFFSGARSVMIGSLASTSLLIAMIDSRRRIYAIIFSTIILAIVIYISSTFYIERYDSTLLERFKMSANINEGNSHWRIQAWLQMIEDIKYKPFLGWPLGSEPRFFVAGHFAHNAPHNEYLKICRVTGILGLFAFISILITFVARAFKYLYRRPKDYYYYQMLGLLLCFIYNIITSCFTQRYTSIDIGLVVWTLPGFMLVYFLEDPKTNNGQIMVSK